MQIRTVAAILAWIIVALLIINVSLRSEWVWRVAIIMLIIAVIVYFIPRLRKLDVKS